jgi:hypothetical protein
LAVRVGGVPWENISVALMPFSSYDFCDVGMFPNQILKDNSELTAGSSLGCIEAEV